MTDMPATADEPVRLLLVDDHPMMRKGVAQLLELEDDLSGEPAEFGKNRTLSLNAGTGRPLRLGS
nr:hypothetical protein [Pseudomonas aeruginosa]